MQHNLEDGLVVLRALDMDQLVGWRRRGDGFDRRKLVRAGMRRLPSADLFGPAAEGRARSHEEHFGRDRFLGFTAAAALFGRHALRPAADRRQADGMEQVGGKIGFGDVFGIERDGRNGAVVGAGRRRQPVEPLRDTKRYRLELNIAVRFEPGVDRNQIIDSVDFDTVARKIDDGPISLQGFAGECLQRFDEPFAAKVGQKFDCFKSGAVGRHVDGMCPTGRNRDVGFDIVGFFFCTTGAQRVGPWSA